MPNIFAKLSEVSLVSWSIIFVIAILSIGGLLIISKKDKHASSTITTKTIVYGGMCVALSFILSYIRLYKMPQGGSITLASIFPIILYSLVFGPVPGIIAGVAYGFMQFIQDPSMVHWAQLFLDYPLAFACLGLAGFAPKLSKNIQVGTTIGIIISVLSRAIMHIISGVVFFAEYAGEQSPLIYSIIYNASYLVPELIITLVLALIIVSTPVYSQLKRSTFI